MQEEWWERPVCILCDWWWAFLLGIALLLAAYFTRNLWLPLVPIPPTATPTSVPPSATAIPTLPLPTLTLTPQPIGTSTRIVDLQTGDVQVTLIWNTTDDLDLWVTDPSGESIYYQHEYSASGGELDVDANVGCGTTQPVENIYWPTGGAPQGQYLVEVQFYKQCDEVSPTDYRVKLLVDGEISEFSGRIIAQGDKQEVTTFNR